MLYEHIAHYVASELWAIDPSKLSEIIGVLAFRAAGGRFTPEEIEARLGDRSAGSAVRTTGTSVAVVPIRGTIAHRMGSMDDSSGGTSAERIGAMFAQAVNDPSVGTILLDVDSPGGTVTGMTELANKMAATKGSK